MKKCGKGKALLLGSKAVVFDLEFASCLFKEGFFGKPVGVKKPKSLEVREPLELSLYEALYLLEKGILDEVIGGEGKGYGFEELIKSAGRQIPLFRDLYYTYRDLRDAGFIVRAAMKYGVDFAVYRKRPGLEHAPYLVKVLRYDDSVDPGDLIGWGRVSHSVRKDLLLSISYPSGERIYITFKWFRP
ncbi:MAG: tRNA-intron lyase [Desulfurococcales archaeon]|nr:tRNA-intron lyase [Desulfurococcales archaeon]